MSHTKERKEKNCLNCNAIVAGRFCQVCGQENIEIHETFGHLANHFISDIFHFDGMFFSTAKHLLFKPGFLTAEYVRGRRASYLNPIKMYIFVSAIFFLFFLSLYRPDVKIDNADILKDYPATEMIKDLESKKAKAAAIIKKNKTPALTAIITKKIAEYDTAVAMLKKDTLHKYEIYNHILGPSFFGENPYDSKAEYDSIQQLLPEKDRDGWFQRQISMRNIEMAEQYRENSNEMVSGLTESFEHHFPQTLFISLPLCALVLQLLYIRLKQFYYVNHLIYTVHVYCALFVFIFVVLLLGKAAVIPYLGWLQWVKVVVQLYAVYYTWQALHRFYSQSWGKTLLKWIILNAATFFIIVALFAIMFFFTIFTMH